jgi:hypothetical protein
VHRIVNCLNLCKERNDRLFEFAGNTG